MGRHLIDPSTSTHPLARERDVTDPDQLDLGLRVDLPTRRRSVMDTAHTMPGRGRAPRGDSWPGHLVVAAAFIVGALVLNATPAWAAAAGAAMPWDAPLTRLVNNLTGPTARLLVTAAVVGAGLLWAFTRNEEGLKKLGQIAFGGAIALGAAALMANLGFAGATF